MATVGPPAIPPTAAIAGEDWSKCTVNIYGGTIGSGKEYESVYMSDFDKYGYGGCVYGGSRGDRGGTSGDLADGETIESYATVLWTEVNINPHPSDRDKDAVIAGNVYGGARGGQIKKDTKVNLTGGTITHNAYGGGQGTADIAADVLGNTTVKLNEGVANKEDAKGCIVNKVFGCNDLNGTPKGHVLVHVYATQTSGQEEVSDKAALPPAYSANKAQDEGYIAFMEKLIEDVTKAGGLSPSATVIKNAQATISGKTEETLTKNDKDAIDAAVEAIDDAMNGLYDSYVYDVAAVYGGGDLAPYEPTSNEEKTEVIIEGCGTTSIRQVYGGGNAASVPATDVTVKSCYIIDELFGGGNGKDNYQKDGKWYENPGAHIGYTQFATYDTTTGSHGTGEDEANKYTAIVPDAANDDKVGADAAKAYRQEHYRYGTGVASSIINGGHVHKAYGGSNEKGNISGEINSQIQQVGTCPIVTDGTYGGSKSATTDATIIVVLDCVENGSEFYGGSYKANINSDVNIHITNGHYTKVFGGNDRAGTVNGKITITVEEYGCTPIVIDELYAGGNLAPYSVYGFKAETQKAKDANGNDIADLDQRIPYRAGEVGARTTPYWDPRINIISATEIGAIYGGGYGAGATLIGNPHINVNMTEGRIRAKYADFKPKYSSYANATDGSGDKVIPIGTIGSIYGGGNLASVEGDTYLEIGTGQWIASWDANGNPVWESTTAGGDKYSYKEKVPAVYYSQAECNEYNSNPANNVTGYIASGTPLSTEQVTAVKAALGTSYVAGAELTTKDANAYNATLSGARKTTDVKSAAVYYTQDECNSYNATLPGAVSTSDTNPNTSASYTQEEANAYNASLPGARKTSDIKTPTAYYTQAECDEYNSSISGYIAKHTKLTAAQATSVNTALTPSYSTGNTITATDANAYNATLPNARKTTDVKTAAVWAWYDADGAEVTTPLDLDSRNAATITGNVFGGGKGVAETTGSTAFTCPKGMIGVDGDGIDYPEGGTSVIIANGKVGTLDNNNKLVAGTGNVYGGGEVGRVEKNTVVTIGVTPKEGETIEDTKFKPTVYGSVFGAGKGVDTHGYSALVRGNSTVTIQGFAKVGESVYGGGEIASIGRYNVVGGIPTSLKNENSGNCIVTVLDNAEIGPNDMTMFHVDESGNIVANDQPDNSGHVFGAGKGAMPGNYNTAQHITDANTMVTGFASEDAYLKFIETLGLATQAKVTIGGKAFVKGDVFGGSEQGFVQHDTHVIIEGDCQIGNGYVQMNADGEYLARKSRYSLNRRYTDTEWSDGHLTGVAGYENSLPECASWEYGQATGDAKYAAHDIYANDYDSKGGRTIADNGSTFYGNVFGGGSGYFPYKAGTWHWKAGDVGGNTIVDIKGGHILTNVYGANELTNVAGKSTINMSGGTIGVPRTLGQIAAHPVTCYLFGGGKGDPRVLFNKQTNVQDVEVNISGGWIYGSVFGGGEDGHVMRDVKMTISERTVETPTYADYYAGRATKIGTWGTSYVDGNVFGGGRGFSGDAYTAGNVGGSVNLTISGGTMLGSVYGGGRLGSVGYGLYEATETDKYGTMRPDDYADDGITEVANFKRGYVTMNITGGTIGNNWEFQNVTADGAYASLSAAKEALATWQTANHVPNTSYETIDNGDGTYTNRLLHTKGGNVYAGGMGRYTQLDGSTAIIAVDWKKLGNVKSTTLTISDTPWIMGNVYGGGEMGAVRAYTSGETVQGGTTTISITGGTIGTEVTETTPQKGTIEVPKEGNSNVKYTFGSVYGGGMGMNGHDAGHHHGGEVSGNTTVTMSGTSAKVRASVFGGGEVAIVDGNTNVTISGGEIGRNEVQSKAGYVMFGGATMGNVYGGGKGMKEHTLAGLVKGNTNVTISGGNIYHNVYGGGALGSVGTFSLSTGTIPDYIPFADIPYDWKYTDGTVINPAEPDAEKTPTGTATVTITGGTIGISGRDNGMVNGSSRGGITAPSGSPKIDPYDKLAWVNNAVVNIGTEGSGTDFSTPLIKGSVYGGGENGHNSSNATVNMYSGTIGIADSEDPWFSFTDATITKKALITRGNIYGAGCGTDTYTISVGEGDSKKDFVYHNPKAGMVGKNTYVNIYGGHVVHNVYGGGSMGSVGTITDSIKHDDKATSFALSWPYKIGYAEGTGKSYVNVTGGRIGMGETGIVGEDNGNIYGGTRGMAGNRYYEAHLANVNETYVTIKYDSTPTGDDGTTTQLIAGSVFGGSEDGHVIGDTHVSIQSGLIKHSIFAGGRGQGTYEGTLKKFTDGSNTTPRQIRSITSGKVYGNTYLEMTGGAVWHNAFGGGYMASVGKGNYSGGYDDYATVGYGETITGNLWQHSAGFNPNAPISPANVPETDADYFLSSGKTYLTITGGTIGRLESDLWDGLPSGCVFGSSRGISAPNITNFDKITPEYCPEFFAGYVNETFMTIGGDYKCVKQFMKDGVMYVPGRTMSARQAEALFTAQEIEDNWVSLPVDGPRIYGSVYGGGQDGHVRREAHMIINKGEIGVPYTVENRAALGTSGMSLLEELNDPRWMLRGNLFGGGSGISPYKFDLDGDGEITEGKTVTVDGVACKETGEYSTSAGSVTHFTVVDVYGGTIHRNIYGGGSLGSVGPPPVGTADITRKGNPADYGKQSQCTVNIAGTVGSPTGYQEFYGGEVYGASRGDTRLDSNLYGSVIWTLVNVLNGANIKGNVFGGGDAGLVKKDTEVRIGYAEEPAVTPTPDPSPDPEP